MSIGGLWNIMKCFIKYHPFLLASHKPWLNHPFMASKISGSIFSPSPPGPRRPCHHNPWWHSRWLGQRTVWGWWNNRRWAAKSHAPRTRRNRWQCKHFCHWRKLRIQPSPTPQSIGERFPRSHRWGRFQHHNHLPWCSFPKSSQTCL